MSEELAGCRNNLIPLLFLPLDGQMITLVPKELRKSSGIKGRKPGFTKIKDESTYKKLQKFFEEKAETISKEINTTKFHPIYFDLLWNGRYIKKYNSTTTKNLFYLNP